MSWSFGIGVVILAAIVVIIVRRGFQFTKLAHDGVAAEGKVIKKYRGQHSRGGMSVPYLRYEYFGPDGRRYEYKITTSEEFYDEHEVGDVIEIVYVKSKPSISAARYLVNQSREALKLPPL